MNFETDLVKHLGLPDRCDFVEKEHIQEVVRLGMYMWNDFTYPYKK